MPNKSDNRSQRGGRLAPSAKVSLAATDSNRVCPYCEEAMPLAEGEGVLTSCECARCRRLVKPRLRTAVEQATKFRNSLRLLVRLQVAPERVIDEVFAELDREIWTNLSGIDGERFKTFEAFCLDPKGLGCDPAPVKALLVNLRGRNATKLLTVPQRRQGHRSDLDATSRPKGEKSSKTSGTDTRLRTILDGPPEVLRAFKKERLSEKAAASLASYAQQHPRCPQLQDILRDLRSFPTEEISAAILRGVSTRIQALLIDPKRKAEPPQQWPLASEDSPTKIPKVTGSTSPGSFAENQTVQAGLARDPSPVTVADHVGTSTTNGTTSAQEIALLRFLGGWLGMVRSGLAGVDPGALCRILEEVREAGRLPGIPRIVKEMELLNDVAELVKSLDPTFAAYAELRMMATREAPPVPAIVQGARDEVARRFKSKAANVR